MTQDTMELDWRRRGIIYTKPIFALFPKILDDGKYAWLKFILKEVDSRPLHYMGMGEDITYREINPKDK